MLNPADARRRWFGSFFLILAAGLLAWGLTFLNDFLVKRPPLFVVYCLACFVLTLLAFGIALYDIRVMRKRIQAEQKSAFSKAFSEAEEAERKKS
jgi:hypothetical protein